MRESLPATCPLCEKPRHPKAKRCACNYVFEYDAPAARLGRSSRSLGGRSSRSLGDRSSRSPVIESVLIVVAIVAASVAIAYIRAQPDAVGRASVGMWLVPIGLFAVLGAVFDWGWFFGARKARLLVMLVSRTGARVFYAALGGSLVGAGIGLLIV